MKFWITIPEAEKLRYCKQCNFAGRLKKQAKPCNYHTHGKSMNYRNVPSGMCALKPCNRESMRADFGVDGNGGINA